MRSPRKGGLSATTQVKVLSPEILNIAQGQRFHFLEASNAVCVKGEHVGIVPGSESVAGNRTVFIGTWEGRTAPESSIQGAEEAVRMYGGTAFGPTHSRGVDGVMPVAEHEVPLEGVGGITERAAYA